MKILKSYQIEKEKFKTFFHDQNKEENNEDSI